MGMTRMVGEDKCSSVLKLLARGQRLHDSLIACEGIGNARLLKLVRAELAFLTRLAGIPNLSPSSAALQSTNLDHLEAVFRILRHPNLDGVSAVMHHFRVPMAESCLDGRKLSSGQKYTGVAHVDVVCMYMRNPVWLVISCRNVKNMSWWDKEHKVKGLRSRILDLIIVASADSVHRPTSILLCFAGEISKEVDQRLKDEFGAIILPAFCTVELPTVKLSVLTLAEVENGEWVDVGFEIGDPDQPNKFQSWVTYEIRLQLFRPNVSDLAQSVSSVQICEDPFKMAPLLSTLPEERIVGCVSKPLESDGNIFVPLSNRSSWPMQLLGTECSLDQPSMENNSVMNLDTTALVALVSELSNGGAELIARLSSRELETRFPRMSKFIHDQALLELEKPLVPELESTLEHFELVVSQFVLKEFSSIVSIIGGPREQQRAKDFLKRLKVVPDLPSDRIMALPESGKIKPRHKIVFGTGDYLHCPTLTANLAFVRAVRQAGMAISIIEHGPRALTGD